jgi:hypothetical protein
MSGLVLSWIDKSPVRLTWAGPEGAVLFREERARKAIAALVGPPGPPGPSGGEQLVRAAEALGGHRAVTADGVHCTPSTLDRLAGITTEAVSAASFVRVLSRGYMTNPAWSWVPDAPVFVGAAGVLTQAPPSGVARRIAWATSSTEINVDLFPIIQLA